MSDRISPQAAAAREAARHATGEFGVQAHTPPESGAGWEPRPVACLVDLHRYTERDEDVEAGQADFDLAAVLDTMPLSEVEALDPNDSDADLELFDRALALGATETVDDECRPVLAYRQDDLDDYIARRRAAGLEAPITGGDGAAHSDGMNENTTLTANPAGGFERTPMPVVVDATTALGDQIIEPLDYGFRVDRVLDSMPLSRVEDIDALADNEDLYDRGVRLGLADRPGSNRFPCVRLDPDALDDYIARRRAAGLIDPIEP